MLTESCVMFFSPSRAVLSAILRDEYLTSAVRTKEGDKAGSNQPPARDPVQFKLELTPNYLISYLENTGSPSTGYVSMPHPNESSILPKFLEKSDPEVGRPVSQHDLCKRLNQRHLRYACRFKSTNQRIATKLDWVTCRRLIAACLVSFFSSNRRGQIFILQNSA